jgi:hypothetical protein
MFIRIELLTFQSGLETAVVPNWRQFRWRMVGYQCAQWGPQECAKLCASTKGGNIMNRCTVVPLRIMRMCNRDPRVNY